MEWFIFLPFVVFFLIIFLSQQAKQQQPVPPKTVRTATLSIVVLVVGAGVGIALIGFLLSQSRSVPVKTLVQPMEIAQPQFLGPITFDANGKAIAPELPQQLPAAQKLPVPVQPPAVLAVNSSLLFRAVILGSVAILLLVWGVPRIIRAVQRYASYPPQPGEFKFSLGLLVVGILLCVLSAATPGICVALASEEVPPHERGAFLKNYQWILFAGMQAGFVLSFATFGSVAKLAKQQLATGKVQEAAHTPRLIPFILMIAIAVEGAMSFGFLAYQERHARHGDAILQMLVWWGVWSIGIVSTLYVLGSRAAMLPSTHSPPTEEDKNRRPAILDAPWYVRAITPQSEEVKKWLPPDQIMGDDGWMPSQKKRIATWGPAIGLFGCIGMYLIIYLGTGKVPMAGELLLVCICFFGLFIIATHLLNRWAFPERGANRPSEIAPPIEVIPVPPPPRTCPKCQSPIAADAPQGLCPRCLMAGAFQSVLHPSRTGPYSGPFAPPTPEEVQEFFPNLEIQGLIGHGGMGAVYQARQPNLDRVVAIKLIRPREDNPMFAERFVREAKAMAKLTHPNIVTIYESGEAGGSLYLIMEFIDGVTLREAIVAKAIDAPAALRIVGQLCDALEYAHAQGVVHRDIKPENILLDRSGKVKVVDFGLAKLSDDNAMSLTHTRQAMGTPHYMAPEQWEKPTQVDHRADIYALGVVIYELLTGELPLGRFDPPSVKAHIDNRIDEIVLRLLAKEPDKRYQNASDVRTAFDRFGDPSHAGTYRHYGKRGRRDYFYEYKSQTEYFGWPLVHVVSGVDPRTGMRRIAKGWIAIGDVMAIGLLSLSGVFALGGVAIAGVFGIGLLALIGGLAVGGIAVGGTAFGFVALGGVALGWLAIGGVAIGKYALGGAAVGEVTNKHGAISNLWERMWADISGWF